MREYNYPNERGGLAMRTVPADLAERYEAAGYWTRDTIGDMLARGLAAAPDTAFRVHSDTRPFDGTFIAGAR